MVDVVALRPIATFCGQCDCGCPQLFVDEAAAPERRIMLVDDFGASIRMSADQFGDLVAQARRGALDAVT
jgi:hypothetical protein